MIDLVIAEVLNSAARKIGYLNAAEIVSAKYSSVEKYREDAEKFLRLRDVLWSFEDLLNQGERAKPFTPADIEDLRDKLLRFVDMFLSPDGLPRAKRFMQSLSSRLAPN